MNEYIKASELSNFLVSKFYNFESHYQNCFAYAKKALNKKNLNISFEIDLLDWRLTAKALKLKQDGDSYKVVISQGFLIRLALLTYALMPVSRDQDGDVFFTSFSVCDVFALTRSTTLNPYDFGSQDKERMSKFLQVLFFDAKDAEQFWASIEKYWDNAFYRSFAISPSTYIPFFWVFDIIVYHEMSHILLNHLEVDLSSVDYSERRFMEGHADFYAAKLLTLSVIPIGKYFNDKIITDELKANLFSLGFLTNVHYALLRGERKSLRYYGNLPHPHPDFRLRMFYLGVQAHFIENGSSPSIWQDIFEEAKLKLNESIFYLGGSGLANDMWDNCIQLGHKEGKKYYKYLDKKFKTFASGCERISKKYL
jgi:hypothetical protein